MKSECRVNVRNDNPPAGTPLKNNVPEEAATFYRSPIEAYRGGLIRR